MNKTMMRGDFNYLLESRKRKYNIKTAQELIDEVSDLERY